MTGFWLTLVPMLPPEPVLDMLELPEEFMLMLEQPAIATTIKTAAIFFILFLQMMR